MKTSLRDEIHQLHANLCSSLADTNRILILYALTQAPSNVSDLAKDLAIPQPGVSRHLKVLREGGLVSSHREGNSVVYSLADERVIEALDILRKVLADGLAKQGALARTVSNDMTLVR